LDPPRAGAKPIVQALSEADADCLVYVSCDPATLSRDLKTLSVANWCIQRATALDLFPNTAHVESVVCLTRVS
ncbi:MAG TPA: 23S rRNA (uracil(1939)-C(5))-methyltransferase RlmD, partial [Candidatus Hydrogenedentes bacterium]|nr:23S rRNA (uracil(1939)-C(5))-methyltransferase RlmD [Candidatus Hydrogenedentota bacterium]